jgi:Ca2+-binding EF-hand superfamily protein
MASGPLFFGLRYRTLTSTTFFSSAKTHRYDFSAASRTAGPRLDVSMLDLLAPAFCVLEVRFAELDQDGGGTLSFEELHSELLRSNFVNGDKLEELFESVDKTKTGVLGFADFTSLVYAFLFKYKNVGDLLFTDPDDARVVKAVLVFLENAMSTYDMDRNRKLDRGEIYQFFQDTWPGVIQSKVLDEALAQLCGDQAAKIEATFPEFMLILYAVTAKSPGSTVKGTYIKDNSRCLKSSSVPGKGENSALWIRIENAFKILELDFDMLDADHDGLLSVKEIYNAIPSTKTGQERSDFMARLSSKLECVQAQYSRQMDFFEYMFLGLIVTRDGSYTDLQPKSKNAAVVKKFFMLMHESYSNFDADKNNRLTYNEVEAMFSASFGEVSPKLKDAFHEFKLKDSGEAALDLARFFQMLYVLVKPDGAFNPSVYHPVKMV